MKLTFQDLLNNAFDESDIACTHDNDEVTAHLKSAITKSLETASYSDLQFIAAEADWDDVIELPEPELRKEILNGVFEIGFEPFQDKERAGDRRMDEEQFDKEGFNELSSK